jgi:hypothetical protein
VNKPTPTPESAATLERITMVRPLVALLSLMTLVASTGCASAPPKAVQPAGKPPTPKSVTLHNPGGDAADPELAALERLATQPFGWKGDKFNTLRVPLIDWSHWQRVKIFGQPSRAAYQYGDEHFAVIALFYTPIEGENDPDRCLQQFLEKAGPPAEAYGVRIGESHVLHVDQKIEGERRPMAIKVLDGSVESLMDSNDYAGAVASFQSWPGTCLIEAFAVVATHHRELAMKVRDRWVAEGAPGIRWEKALTSAPPTSAR